MANCRLSTRAITESVSHRRPTASNGISNELQRYESWPNLRCYLGTKRNHETPQSGQQFSETRFETGSSHIRSRNAGHYDVRITNNCGVQLSEYLTVTVLTHANLQTCPVSLFHWSPAGYKRLGSLDGSNQFASRP
jgi:hypothetical protein